jgi:signal peptide peptidase SppA
MEADPTKEKPMTQNKPVMALQAPRNTQALSYLTGRKWAMHPSALNELREAMLSHPKLEQALAEGKEFAASIPDGPQTMYGGERLNGCRYTYKRGDLAIITLDGPMFSSGGLWDEIMAFYFGGTKTQTLMRDIQIAAEDPEIAAIVLKINSPGGEAFGINELANTIHAARAKKPIVGYAYGYCASAAYWTGAACETLVADAEALLGSIGVVAIWADFTGYYEMFGIAFEEVTSSNAPYKRLDIREPEERKVFMAEIDGMEKVFIDSVAKFRDVKRDDVIENFGKGAVLAGHLAVKANMADAVDSFEGVIRKMTAAKKNGSRAYSAAGEDMSLMQKVTTFIKSLSEDEAATLNLSDAPSSEHDSGAAPDAGSPTLNSEAAIGLPESGQPAKLQPGEEAMNKDKDLKANEEAPATDAAAQPAATAAAPALEEPAAAAAPEAAKEDEPTADAALAEREAALDVREAALKDREEKAESTLAETAAAQRKARFEAIAADFAGDKPAKVQMMESLADKFTEESDEFKAYVEDQKALSAQITAGGLFKEAGAPGAGSESDPKAQLDAKAAVIQKEEGITKAAAYTKACQQNSDLYDKMREGE